MSLLKQLKVDLCSARVIVAAPYCFTWQKSQPTLTTFMKCLTRLKLPVPDSEGLSY
jgi:hypothetical protein